MTVEFRILDLTALDIVERSLVPRGGIYVSRLQLFMRTAMNGRDTETTLAGDESFNARQYGRGSQSVAMLRAGSRLIARPLGSAVDAYSAPKRSLMLLASGCAISGNFDDDSGEEQFPPGRVAVFLGDGNMDLHHNTSVLSYPAWELEWLDASERVVMSLKNALQ